MDIICSFRMEATLVANTFIDEYMANASGEYVKVYLYLLRHQQDAVSIEQIADALNHTESDVKRALAYWEKLGALQKKTVSQDGLEQKGDKVREVVAEERQESTASPSGSTALAKRNLYSQEQVNQLAEDEDFTQLLYIAQKYMNKVFTPRECEVFAYLYDGLHMPAELLEYLVEYCVQGGHTSIRYIETVGLNWHERGLCTVEMARAYASGFTKDSFAVMRCFGLTDRKPGDAEKQMIEKWFSAYGFSREVVLEACNRTLEAIHSPSFRYADKILSEWKKAGVRTVRDITLLDEKRQEKKSNRAVKKAVNQFHNFEQRSTDYDAMMLDQVKSWIGQG
ncbi:MAG: DnaD domain protein [Lachnospiraceae bacterium]|nr:DnaD domain protein [Lachnospiraceae bacterium]MCI9282715.1 DnaD domain protein [Lachnospiraceae bacterium]